MEHDDILLRVVNETIAIKDKLSKENAKLKADLKQKEAQLSEFQKGIPIEKAKELDQVLITDWELSSTNGELWRGYKKAEVAVVSWMSVPYLNWAGTHHWFDENNGVIYKNPKAFFVPPSETQEGS